MILKSFLAKAKAFTLFTAMVSFVIIGIGVIVMQHISNSEQNYSQIILSLQNQQELDSAKDLIRLDALKVFDVLYRAKFYDFYGTSYHDVGLQDHDWNTFREQYVKELFFGNPYGSDKLGSKFADFIGNKLLGLLFNYSGNFKGSQYFFRIYGYQECVNGESKSGNKKCDPLNLNENPNISTQYISPTMSESFITSYGTGNFLKLINCDLIDSSKCDNGSFYTNIYGNLISDNSYLSMPRIIIKRNIDNSAIDDSIFPRNVISLYMPMRLFGALDFVRNRLSNSEIKTKLAELESGDYDLIPNSGCEGSITIQEKPDNSFKNYDFVSIGTLININNNANGFRLDLNDIENQKEYTSKIFQIKVLTGNTTVQTYVQNKLQQVKVNVVVNDTLKEFTFGRSTDSNFGYSGVISNIQGDNPSISYTICSCKNVDVQNDLSTYTDCNQTSNGSINANDQDIESQLKNAGLDPSAISQIKGQIITQN